MNAVPTSPPLDNLQKLPQKLDILTHWNWFEYFCDDADRFHWKYLHDYFVDEDVDLWWCWWHWLRMHLAGIELRSGWFDIKFNCTYPFTANIVGFLFSVIIIIIIIIICQFYPNGLYQCVSFWAVFKKLQDFFVGHPAFHRQYCRFPIPHHHHYHQHLQYPRNLHDTKSWLTMHSCAQRKFQAFRKGENGKPRPLVHNFKFCGNLRSLWICFRKIRNLWTSTVYHPEKLQTKVLDM